MNEMNGQKVPQPGLPCPEQGGDTGEGCAGGPDGNSASRTSRWTRARDETGPAAMALALAAIASAAAWPVPGVPLKIVTWLAVIAVIGAGASLARVLAARRRPAGDDQALTEPEP